MMAAFQNTRSKIEPSGIDRRAVGGRAELSAGRINGGGLVGKIATVLKGEKFSPGEKLTPNIETDAKLKADFAKVIRLYPTKVLADAADCSVDTVKCWKAKRSFPHGTHLMRLVADFPQINAWHSRRTGGLNHPQSQVEVYSELERILGENSARGRAMRARYQEIVRGAQ